MINTGSTLTLAAQTLNDKGAKSVHALISHGKGNFTVLCPRPGKLTSSYFLPGLLSESNKSLIQLLPIERLVVRA